MRITRKDLDLIAEAYNDMSGPRSMENTTSEDAETKVPAKVTGPPRKKLRFKSQKSLKPNGQKMTVGSVKPPRKKLKFFSQEDKDNE
jgi:hypothetical protein